MTLDEFIVAALASGKFVVDEQGRIFNTNVRGTGLRAEVAGKLMPKGYLRCSLYLDGDNRSVLNHRMVAIAFHGMPPFEGAQVNHRNGIKRDNRPANLEWATCSQNIQHAWDTGLKSGSPAGSRNPNAKLDERRAKMIRVLVQAGFNQSEVGRAFGVSHSVVSRVARGESWANPSPDR